MQSSVAQLEGKQLVETDEQETMLGGEVFEGETTVGGGFVIDNAVICCSAGGEALGEETDE